MRGIKFQFQELYVRVSRVSDSGFPDSEIPDLFLFKLNSDLN